MPSRESIVLDPAEVIMFDVVGRISDKNRFGQRYIMCKLSEEQAAECEAAGLPLFTLQPRTDTDEEPAPGIRIKIAYPPATLPEDFRARITPQIKVRCDGVDTMIDEDMSYGLGEIFWDRVALAIRPRFIKMTGRVTPELEWLVIDTHKSRADLAREKYGLGRFDRTPSAATESELPFE